MKIKSVTIMLFVISITFSCSPYQPGGINPGREQFFMTNRITQYGITWTFDREYPAGQFVTGDYWVAGPVTLIDIDPPSVVSDGRVINGSMLNPGIADIQGYDTHIMGSNDISYSAALNAARPGGLPLSISNPLYINEGSLISAVSYPEIRSSLNVRVMAVLTIVNRVPPAGSFRPPYTGSNKTVSYNMAQVNMDLLPGLPAPGVPPAITDTLARFEKPWIEHMHTWAKEKFCAPENMPNYGREVAGFVSEAAVLLCLEGDRTLKTALAYRIIQLGIDNHGILQVSNGRTTWAANGGHMPGRAFPILFAAYMLNAPALALPFEKTGRYAYMNGYHEGSLPPDYIHFGEIDQTFYVTLRDVDRTYSDQWAPDTRAPSNRYETNDIGMPEWGIEHAHTPAADNKNHLAMYRSVNLPSWTGFIMASRVLGIISNYNHPALFDYTDRWMAVQASLTQRGANTDFMQAFWDMFRSVY